MKVKVLIAEDSKLFHKMIDASLSDELYEKRFVADGEQALETADQWKPDVLVLDMMMPVMSGYAALKKLREGEKASGASRKLPVVMLTGVSDKQSILDCGKLGIQGYLVKPFKPEDIADRIEAALHHAEGR